MSPSRHHWAATFLSMESPVLPWCTRELIHRRNERVRPYYPSITCRKVPLKPLNLGRHLLLFTNRQVALSEPIVRFGREQMGFIDNFENGFIFHYCGSQISAGRLKLGPLFQPLGDLLKTAASSWQEYSR